MIREYSKFFINGGALGVLALILQLTIYKSFTSRFSNGYAIASCVTYVPLVFINFQIQRAWIFNKSGIFYRFILANLIIMAMVSIVSPIFQNLINSSFTEPWGDRFGFALAALLCSIPSFFLKRIWVFEKSINR